MSEPAHESVVTATAGGFGTAAELLAAAGTDLGVSGWVTVDRERVERFAAATGDSGPPGHAPEMLTLSLLAPVLAELLRVPGATMGVNYGVEDVRFPAPVPVGARIRGRARLAEATEVRGAVQVAVAAAVEREGHPDPACVVRMLARFSFEPVGSRS